MRLESIKGCVLNRNYSIKPSSNENKSYERQSFDMPKNSNHIPFKAMWNYITLSNKTNKNLPKYLIENLPIETLKQAQNFKNKLNKYIDTSDGFLENIVKTSNYDFIMLEKLFDEFIARDIYPVYFNTTINSVQVYSSPLEDQKEIDYESVIRLLSFRDKAIEHKQLLSSHGRTINNSEVDRIVFNTPSNTIETLNIIGENASIQSLKDKTNNVCRYIEKIGKNTLTPENREKLIQLTNPTFSEKYKDLKAEIRAKKSSYQNVEGDAKKQLEKEINTLTYNLNELRKNAIKEPKNILETALIAVSFPNKTRITDDFLAALHDEKDLTSEKLCNILSDNFYHYYKLEKPSAKVTERLQFRDKKYLLEIFKSNENFRNAFEDLIILMETAPEKNNIELFNTLPQNIETRKQFKELGLDYDKWASSDYIGHKTDRGYTVRKVDMNDIPYALFLGNYSDCCTKSNGIHSASAIAYIKNKMFQAIEILDKNDKPIGNTMCFIAKINKTPCLVLDNIEMHTSYRAFEDDLHLLEHITIVAQKIAEHMGAPDLPILLVAKTNDLTTVGLPTKEYLLELVGSTGKNMVYFDFARHGIRTSDFKSSLEYLHPMTYNCPSTSDTPSPDTVVKDLLTSIISTNNENHNIVTTNINPLSYYELLND